MHVAHDTSAVARAGDCKDCGPLVPSNIEADAGACEQGQTDFTDLRCFSMLRVSPGMTKEWCMLLCHSRKSSQRQNPRVIIVNPVLMAHRV